MTRYKFTKDFPPTAFKKGDEVQYDKECSYFISKEVALLLATGIVEEVKEGIFAACGVCGEYRCTCKKENEEDLPAQDKE